MAAVTSALIAIAGVVLGWIAIEIACKPCLEKGREAIDRSLNPDYDPDDDEIRVPINPPNWSPTTTESTARPWFPHRLGFFSSKTSNQGCLILSFKSLFLDCRYLKIFLSFFSAFSTGLTLWSSLVLWCAWVIWSFFFCVKLILLVIVDCCFFQWF